MNDRLSDYEIEELLRRCPVEMQRDLARLLRELREMRDTQAAREFMADQEVTW